jgi:hypothetical protein
MYRDFPQRGEKVRIVLLAQKCSYQGTSWVTNKRYRSRLECWNFHLPGEKKSHLKHNQDKKEREG